MLGRGTLYLDLCRDGSHRSRDEELAVSCPREEYSGDQLRTIGWTVKS